MSIHIHEKLVLLSALSVGTIEAVHQMPINEVIKIGIQSAIGLLTIVYLIFKILNERKKLKQ